VTKTTIEGPDDVLPPTEDGSSNAARGVAYPAILHRMDFIIVLLKHYFFQWLSKSHFLMSIIWPRFLHVNDVDTTKIGHQWVC
jgi:hypothetical protein